MSLTFKVILSADEFTASAELFCADLDLHYFPTPWKKEDWKNLFESDRLLVVAFWGERPIGFCLFELSRADSFGHLLKIIIHPDGRGKGAGLSLLENTLKTLQSQSIKSQFLEVEEHNVRAQAIYERAGFKKIHLRKQFYSNGSNAWIMTRDD